MNTIQSEYILTVGLEIHAELRTRTKMFCDSKNDPDEVRPNVNVCPICVGHPGTLPVMNKEAVRHVLKVGLALGGRLADFTEFTSIPGQLRGVDTPAIDVVTVDSTSGS